MLIRETLIEAAALSKSFADKVVLEQVDFRILPREVVTIVGLNGCGKTTLLKILIGLEKADSGTITSKPGLRIGYVPQRFQMDAAIPVRVENFLRFSALNNALFDRYVDALNISHLLRQPMHGLSGGESQRVLLARAMMRNPELLVLDEPVQGVDISGQTKLYQLISQFNKQDGVAVLMVSHDLHLVMAATDHVICLNRHVCCSGHPVQVSKDPAFLHLFGAAGAQALAFYEHHHDHNHNMHGDVVTHA